jgi:hypothetical protein
MLSLVVGKSMVNRRIPIPRPGVHDPTSRSWGPEVTSTRDDIFVT